MEGGGQFHWTSSIVEEDLTLSSDNVRCGTAERDQVPSGRKQPTFDVG